MNENEIKNWLKKHDITEYNIYQNLGEPLAVDILESVDLSYTNLQAFPFKIYHVQGDFKAIGNHLTSLFNGPTEVYGSFLIGNNKLKSLNFGPKIVRGNYNCSNNQIQTLKHLPKECRKLKCFYNPLTTLKHFKTQPLRELELDIRQIALTELLGLNVEPEIKISLLLFNSQLDELKKSGLQKEIIEYHHDERTKNFTILPINYSELKPIIEKMQLENKMNNSNLVASNKKVKL